MYNFVHHENIERFKKLIAIVEHDPARDERRYQMLWRLLAEEQVKQHKPHE